MKMEIMRNKYKLKGDRIFIENDVSWEEKRVIRCERTKRKRRDKDKVRKGIYGKSGQRLKRKR